MKKFNRYLYAIAGEDPNNFDQHHVDTQRRTSNFGLLIHVPMVIWFLIGFYMTSYLFESSTIFSLLVGVVAVLIIYAIDRSIINSAKTKALTIARISLGIIFAVAGAFLVDVMLFEKDIDQYLANQDAQSVRESYQVDMAQLSTDVSKPVNEQAMQSHMQQRGDITREFAQKRQDVTKVFDQEISRCGLFCSEAPIIIKRDKALNDLAIQEKQALDLINAKIDNLNASSTAKSPRGRGPVWEAKQQYADQLKQEYLEAENELEMMQLAMGNEVDTAQLNSGTNNGLITKVKALHAIAFEQTESMIFYLVFFCVLLAFELVLVLTKVFSPLTIDDRRAEYVARQQQRQMDVDEEQLRQYQSMLAEQEGRSYGV
jgi:hypothetical protein